MSGPSILPDLAVTLVFIGYAMVMLLSFGGLLTWVERKQSAIMADRVGANRAYIRIPFTNIKLVWLGLFHGMADGLKMLLKENFKPNTHDKVGYFLAPFIVFTPVLLVFAVVPFGGTVIPGQLIPALADWFGDRSYPMQIASLDAGLLVVFAFSGLGIIGAMLAGWASDNKFSLLGGLRAGSQMISYELVLALTVLGLILIYGTVDLRAIVQQQSGTIGGVLPAAGGLSFSYRGHRRKQADPVRSAGSGIGAHRRILHGVQCDEARSVHVLRVHSDRRRGGALRHVVFGRLQSAVHDRRRLSAAWWDRDRAESHGAGAIAAAHVPGEGGAAVCHSDPDPLDAPALSI
jgi:hypothetical protein